MLRKFFTAVILIAFMLSTQTTFAEIPIDWSKVRQVSSKSALRAYLDEANKSGQTIVPVILTNGLNLSGKDLLALSSSSMIHWDVKGQNAQNTWLVLTLKDYPGTRVANAYLSGNTSWLSTDEMKLYKVASAIADKINKANTKESPTAMDIYFQIMKRTTYLTGDMDHQPRFVTAIGALVDGKANCQGYADAFYMLGRMCGLNVGRISGTANGEPHMWNTVTYGDGKTYFIDATAGDDAIKKTNGSKDHSYIYFNAPVEIMQVTHKWDSSLAPPNLQPAVDFRYSYSQFWGGNLARATSAEAGIKIVAQKLAGGSKWFSVMTPLDEKYFTNSQEVTDYISKESGKNIYLNTRKYGKWMFFTAHLR